jgi:hypothetical protein
VPKLPTFNGYYIPKDLEFLDDDKKIVPNSELPKDKQVQVEMTYATLNQKNDYMQVYSESKKRGKVGKLKTEMLYDQALKKHVKKIDNLSDENGNPLTNGFLLVACQNPWLNDFKQDLFNRICGVRVDEEEDDGPGELTEGED